MAMSGWQIGAIIRFSSNGPQVMQRIASSTTMLNAQLARQQWLIDKNALATIRYQQRLEALRATALRTATAISGVFAIGGAVAIGAAVTDAAKLQQILLSIKNETGASKSQLEGFYKTAFTIANQNAMTPVEAGEVLRTISRMTAGQFTIDQMQKIAPTVAGFASSVHFNRPDVSVDDAARTGIATSHLFRAYQPAALTKLLDSVYRLSGLMVEKPEQALRQMSSYVPLFKNLGVGNESSIALMALLDRAGFRNKVGTNVRAEVLQALGPLQLTQHMQSGKMGLLTAIGLFKNGKFAWNTQDGGLNFFGELAQIGKWAAAQRAKGVSSTDIARTMFGAFGKQGGTIAALFGDPQMVGILAGLQRYLHDPNVGLGAAQQNRGLSTGFQFQRAVSNLTAVMTELGYPWLQQLTSFFKNLADRLHGFQAWLHSHRDAEKMIGAVVAGITALAGVFFTLGAIVLPIMKFAKWIGAESGIAKMFTGRVGFGLIGDLALRFGSKFIPVVGWILLAIDAFNLLTHNWPNLVKAASDWWGRSRAGIGYWIGFAFGMIAKMLIDAIKGLWQMVVSLGGTLLQNAIPMMLALATGNTNAIGALISNNFKNWHPTGASFGSGLGAGLQAGFGGGTTVHKVEMHFPNVKDGAGVRRAFDDVTKNPQSYLGRGGSAGSAFLPTPVLTTAWGGGVGR